MLNFIVGENASGKTLYLLRLVESFGLRNVITNVVRDFTLDKCEFNKNRIDLLEDAIFMRVRYGSVESEISVETYDGAYFGMSPDFRRILTMMCKDREILILDEPDYGMSETEVSMLRNFLDVVAHTFKDVYIVTHDEELVSDYETNIYTVRTSRDGEQELIEVSNFNEDII